MSLFSKLRGTIENFFQLGILSTSHGIKDNAIGVEARTEGDTSSGFFVQTSQQFNQAGIYDAQLSSRIDLKQRCILLEFSFDGGSLPPLGPLNGQYGICHTAGGIYTVGTIYYCNGVVLQIIPMYKMQTVCNETAFVGTLSMQSFGFYIAEIGVSPYNWTLMGDGTAGEAGDIKLLVLPFAFSDFGLAPTIKQTATVVPNNAAIARSGIKITTSFTMIGLLPFDGTVALDIAGAPVTNLMLTTDSNLSYPAKVEFDVDEGTSTGLTGAGKLQVTLSVGGSGNLPLAGQANAFIEFCPNPMS